MINKMVVANVAHRPVRSLISIVAIALEVTLILLIVGLCYGIMNDSRRTALLGLERTSLCSRPDPRFYRESAALRFR